MKSFVLIGGGNAGSLLARRLVSRSWSFLGFSDPDPAVQARMAQEYGMLPVLNTEESFPENDLCIVAVPDDRLENLCRDLDARLLNTRHLLHPGGFTAADVFDAVRNISPDIEKHALHPLVSIPGPAYPAAYLDEVYFAIDGDNEAWMTELAADLGAGAFRMNSQDRRWYHTAAVLAGNLSLAVWAAAEETAAETGLDEGQFRKVFRPLIQSVLNNYIGKGSSDALSGPVKRGDSHLIDMQMTLLGKLNNGSVREVYDVLTRYLIRTRQRETGDET